MTQQIVNISAPDDDLGDPLRTAFDKTNQNFTELYGDRFRTARAIAGGVGDFGEPDLNGIVVNTNTANSTWDASNLATETNGVVLLVNNGVGSIVTIQAGTANVAGDLTLAFKESALVIYTAANDCIVGKLTGASGGGLEPKGIVTADTNTGPGIYSLDASGAAFNWTLPAATGSQDRYLVNSYDVAGNPATVRVQAGEFLNGVVNDTQVLATNYQMHLAVDQGAGDWALFAVGGDDLGDHSATQALNLNGFPLFRQAKTQIDYAVSSTVVAGFTGAHLRWTAATGTLTIDSDTITAGATDLGFFTIENDGTGGLLTLAAGASLTGGISGDTTLVPGEFAFLVYAVDGLSARVGKFGGSAGASLYSADGGLNSDRTVDALTNFLTVNNLSNLTFNGTSQFSTVMDDGNGPARISLQEGTHAILEVEDGGGRQTGIELRTGAVLTEPQIHLKTAGVFQTTASVGQIMSLVGLDGESEFRNEVTVQTFAVAATPVITPGMENVIVADTSGGSFTLTFAAPPDQYTRFTIVDDDGEFGTNPLTLAGANFNDATPMVLDRTYGVYNFYADGAAGWNVDAPGTTSGGNFAAITVDPAPGAANTTYLANYATPGNFSLPFYAGLNPGDSIEIYNLNGNTVFVQSQAADQINGLGGQVIQITDANTSKRFTYDGTDWSVDTSSAGDDLGNHTATQALEMSDFEIRSFGLARRAEGASATISGADTGSVVEFSGTGPFTVTVNDNGLANVTVAEIVIINNTANTLTVAAGSASITGATAIEAGGSGYVRIITDAAFVVGGGGDNLGTHVATQFLDMANNDIIRSSIVPAVAGTNFSTSAIETPQNLRISAPLTMTVDNRVNSGVYMYVWNDSGGVVTVTNATTGTSNGLPATMQDQDIYLLYWPQLDTVYATRVGSSPAAGIDDVLSVGQQMTADRTLDLNGNQLEFAGVGNLFGATDYYGPTAANKLAIISRFLQINGGHAPGAFTATDAQKQVYTVVNPTANGDALTLNNTSGGGTKMQFFNPNNFSMTVTPTGADAIIGETVLPPNSQLEATRVAGTGWYTAVTKPSASDDSVYGIQRQTLVVFTADWDWNETVSTSRNFLVDSFQTNVTVNPLINLVAGGIGLLTLTSTHATATTYSFDPSILDRYGNPMAPITIANGEFVRLEAYSRDGSEAFIMNFPRTEERLTDAAEQSANFTAAVGNEYPVDSTGGAITVNPPAAPAVNDVWALYDSRTQASTNNITVDFITAGQLLNGQSNNSVLDLDQDYARYKFVGGAIGWRINP